MSLKYEPASEPLRIRARGGAFLDDPLNRYRGTSLIRNGGTSLIRNGFRAGFARVVERFSTILHDADPELYSLLSAACSNPYRRSGATKGTYTLQGHLAHKKQPPPPRTTIGPYT